MYSKKSATGFALALLLSVSAPAFADVDFEEGELNDAIELAMVTNDTNGIDNVDRSIADRTIEELLGEDH